MFKDLTSGLCIIIIFDSLSFVSTSNTQEQVGDGVAGDNKNLTVFFDDNYDDIPEEFVLSEIDLGSFSMSLSLSMSMTNEEELVQETGGEMRLRGAAKHDVYKAIS